MNIHALLIIILLSLAMDLSAKQQKHTIPIVTLVGQPLVQKSPTHLSLFPSPQKSIFQYKDSFLIFKTDSFTHLAITRSHVSKTHSSKYTPFCGHSPNLTITLYQGRLFINNELDNELSPLRIITPKGFFTLKKKYAQYIITPDSIIQVTPSKAPQVRELFAPCHVAWNLIKASHDKPTN